MISQLNTHYGELNIIETDKHFIFEVSTGGWSENETIISNIEETDHFDLYEDGGHYVKCFKKAYLDKSIIDNFRLRGNITKQSSYKREFIKE
jgi:hypothetical protein